MLGELITLSLIEEPQHDRHVPTRDACANRMLILTGARAKQVFSLYSARAKLEGGKHERPDFTHSLNPTIQAHHKYRKSA